jgi:hypothetical protein
MTLEIVDHLVTLCGILCDDEELNRPVHSVDNGAIVRLEHWASVAAGAAITQKLTRLPHFRRLIDTNIRRPAGSVARKGKGLESRERLGHIFWSCPNEILEADRPSAVDQTAITASEQLDCTRRCRIASKDL